MDGGEYRGRARPSGRRHNPRRRLESARLLARPCVAARRSRSIVWVESTHRDARPGSPQPPSGCSRAGPPLRCPRPGCRGVRALVRAGAQSRRAERRRRRAFASRVPERDELAATARPEAGHASSTWAGYHREGRRRPPRGGPRARRRRGHRGQRTEGDGTPQIAPATSASWASSTGTSCPPGTRRQTCCACRPARSRGGCRSTREPQRGCRSWRPTPSAPPGS